MHDEPRKRSRATAGRPRPSWITLSSMARLSRNELGRVGLVFFWQGCHPDFFAGGQDDGLRALGLHEGPVRRPGWSDSSSAWVRVTVSVPRACSWRKIAPPHHAAMTGDIRFFSPMTRPYPSSATGRSYPLDLRKAWRCAVFRSSATISAPHVARGDLRHPAKAGAFAFDGSPSSVSTSAGAEIFRVDLHDHLPGMDHGCLVAVDGLYGGRSRRRPRHQNASVDGRGRRAAQVMKSRTEYCLPVAIT